MKLLPKGRSIDLRYECPDCNSDIWLTEKEGNTQGFMISCSLCQAIHQIEAVELSIRATPLSKIEIWQNDNIMALTGIYNRKQIEAAIIKLGKKKQFTEDDIKKIIILIEEENGPVLIQR